jgi:hypothetical protein
MEYFHLPMALLDPRGKIYTRISSLIFPLAFMSQLSGTNRLLGALLKVILSNPDIRTFRPEIFANPWETMIIQIVMKLICWTMPICYCLEVSSVPPNTVPATSSVARKDKEGCYFRIMKKWNLLKELWHSTLQRMKLISMPFSCSFRGRWS